MRFQGGKFRLGKRIAEEVRSFTRYDKVWEPFVGGANVTVYLVERFKVVWASDVNEHLINMYRAVCDGWKPPRRVTKAQYDHYRINKPQNDPMTGFVGYAASFRGKWFGGWNGSVPRNRFVETSYEWLLKSPLSSVEWFHACYRSITIPRCAIYCDPPYANTTRHHGDSGIDWKWVRAAVNKGADVVVSEAKCPIRADKVIDLVGKICTGLHRQNGEAPTEKLFCFRGRR